MKGETDMTINLSTDEIESQGLKFEDLGEGFLVVSFYRPLLNQYYRRVIPMLKRANPKLVITSIVAIQGFNPNPEAIESVGIVEVWINFEEKPEPVYLPDSRDIILGPGTEIS
jgi:hypothetical protein